MDRMSSLKNQWDRASGWTAIALGGVLLVLGWLGVSRYALVPSQLPYLVSGGLGGIFLLGLGATLLLSADLQDEWRELDDLERKLEAVEEKIDRLAAAGDEPPLTTVVPGPPAELVMRDAEPAATNGTRRSKPISAKRGGTAR